MSKHALLSKSLQRDDMIATILLSVNESGVHERIYGFDVDGGDSSDDEPSSFSRHRSHAHTMGLMGSSSTSSIVPTHGGHGGHSGGHGGGNNGGNGGGHGGHGTTAATAVDVDAAVPPPNDPSHPNHPLHHHHLMHHHLHHHHPPGDTQLPPQSDEIPSPTANIVSSLPSQVLGLYLLPVRSGQRRGQQKFSPSLLRQRSAVAKLGTLKGIEAMLDR